MGEIDTAVFLSESNNAFDTGGALEDGDGFLDGGNDSKGFRSGGGEYHGLTGDWGFKGDTMERRLKWDSVRVWDGEKEGVRGGGRREEDRVSSHSCKCSLHSVVGSDESEIKR